MKDYGNGSEKEIVFVRDKIFNEGDEKELEQNIFPKNFSFNLECQKINNTLDSQTKFNIEFQNLIEFVKESSHYRDLNGNRIVSKGELLPTPYQRLEKINQDIRNFYENKLSPKKCLLMIKNMKNKNYKLLNNLKVLNTLNDRYRSKSKNNISLKKIKTSFEKPFNRILNISKSISNKSLQSNIFLSINKNKIKVNPNKTNFDTIPNSFDKQSINNNKVCLSEASKKSKIKYFPSLQFNEINFWKSKLLYQKPSNKNNNRDNIIEDNKKYDNYLNELNRNKEKLNNFLFNISRKDYNEILNKTNKDKIYGNKNKVKDFSKELNKYNTLQFNLNKLFKRDKVNKDKIIINIKQSKKNFTKKNKIEFKTITTNMNSINKKLSLKNDDFVNKLFNRTDKNKSYKSFDIHKQRMEIYY